MILRRSLLGLGPECWCSRRVWDSTPSIDLLDSALCSRMWIITQEDLKRSRRDPEFSATEHVVDAFFHMATALGQVRFVSVSE